MITMGEDVHQVTRGKDGRRAEQQKAAAYLVSTSGDQGMVSTGTSDGDREVGTLLSRKLISSG